MGEPAQDGEATSRDEIGRISEIEYIAVAGAVGDGSNMDSSEGGEAEVICRVPLRELWTTPQGHGTVLWKGASMLGRWLVAQPEAVRGCDVLEVGAGCGLAGLTALQVGASRVLLTDCEPQVLENLAEITDIARAHGIPQDSVLQVSRLDFCDEESALGGRLGELCAQFEVLLATEVLYSSDKRKGLVNLVRAFLRQGKLAAIGHTSSPLGNTAQQAQDLAAEIRCEEVEAVAFWEDAAVSAEGGSTLVLCWPSSQCPAWLAEVQVADGQSLKDPVALAMTVMSRRRVLRLLHADMAAAPLGAPPELLSSMD